MINSLIFTALFYNLLNCLKIEAYSLEGLIENEVTYIKQICRKIRCPLCNGQAINESFIDNSTELKQKVTDQVRLGHKNQRILKSLKKEYGNDILFNPKTDPSTFLLWSLPWVFLLSALSIAINFIFKKTNKNLSK